MLTRVILTVIGSDRPGLTEALAGAVLAAGGNWLEGHLARLGGKYVGSVLVELPAAGLETLRDGVAHVDAAGLKVDIVVAGDAAPQGAPLELSVTGQDRPGIVREVAAVLAGLGVNIEALETEIADSAWSGSPLFKAQAQLLVPPGVSEADVQAALEAISGEIMVDFTVAAA
ncbi:MAG: glycine cleavage system protein R [Polymorphobacter sp.]